jgi:mono/diheme cytochrome c family protein
MAEMLLYSLCADLTSVVLAREGAFMKTMWLGVGVLALLPLVASGGPEPKRTEKAKETDDPPEIPAEARTRPNPIVATEETLHAGRALWHSYCESCHGAAGKGDGPDARLHELRKGHAPRDLTDPKVQTNLTDGEIFWRITHGIVENEDVIMPAYEAKIAGEKQRWQTVLYVRELGRAARK